jgi:ADP-heptose:LPS heptosyltransferase
MSLGPRLFLRACYWRLRRRPSEAAHMLAAAARALALAFRLWLARRWLACRWAGRGPAGRRRSLAIVLVDRMGDIVAAEPIARLARERFPDARIHWIVQAPYAALPQTYPQVDAVVTVGCLTEWMLLETFRPFDVVWNLHINSACCPRCCVMRDDPGVPGRLDYLDHGGLLASQCLSAGLAAIDAAPVIVPPPSAVAAVDALALPARCIVIHADPAEPARAWTLDKWRALVARLLAAAPEATLLEIGTRRLVLAQDGARQRSLCGRLSLLQTAEVIRRASLFVGIDSGPAHLANAVGTPGVILLGRYRTFPSYTPFSGGYADGTRATLLRAALLHAGGAAASLPVEGLPVEAVPVEDVFAAVMARLAMPAPPAPAPASPADPRR